MIRFKNVSKHYNPDIVALEDITFDIDSGEFLFLIGASGAGKSTVIRLLIRQELPTQGSIGFEDIEVTEIPRHQLPSYRQKIGVVFQDYKLLETKTIRENINFALEITGKPDDEIADTTQYLLEVVKLEKRSELFPQQLSGGEKQRASIARALANDPKLLIADEPTGNLDPKTSSEIMEILEKINSWGTTVMIATHAKEIVDQYNRRILKLEEGRLVSDLEGKYDSIHVDEQQFEETQPKVSKVSEQDDEECLVTIDSEITVLDLPSDIEKILTDNKVETLENLLDLTEEDLKNIKGLGKKKTEIILAKLEQFLNGGENKE